MTTRDREPARRRPSGRRWRLWLGAWIVLLIASHAVQALRPPPPVPAPGAGRLEIDVPARDDAGAERPETVRVSVLRFEPPDGVSPDSSRPAVVLLHGSPGDAGNMAPLGSLLARGGRRVVALDLPGFGRSEARVPSYSIRAHAGTALDVVAELGFERVHWVGWSMGGGVALHAVDRDPSRAASLTLLASIGVQEAEGSGSWFFEHVKYAALHALLVVAPEVVPHFGLLGPRAPRVSFVRNFWDTDLRPVRARMERLATPTLIVHGCADFLVPPRAARLHHELVRPSTLAMIEGSHFLPWREPLGNLQATAAHLAPFLDRHDAPDAPARRRTILPAEAASCPTAWPGEPLAVHGRLPWWLLLAVLAGAVAVLGGAAVAALAVAVATFQLDPGLAAIACLLGAAARRSGRRPLAHLGGAALMVGALAGQTLVAAFTYVGLEGTLGPVASWVAAVVATVGVWALTRVPGRWRARRRAAADAPGRDREGIAQDLVSGHDFVHEEGRIPPENP